MSDTNIILPSKPRVVSEDATKGTYEIDNLYPGYGHTLGNSLRRIILSSLPGAAITSLKIEGVPHEFSTIEGVKEDSIVLLLNLKRVRFKLLSEGPQVVTLSVKGAKRVTAGDIKTSGQVEVLNPDQYICELTEKNSSIEMEITVEKGLGFVQRDVHQKGKVDIGTIAVDAIFTPIRRVAYEVENMRYGDKTNYNRLRIIIETDGTLSPREALERSTEIMILQLQAIFDFKGMDRDAMNTLAASHEAPALEAKEEESKIDVTDILKTRVDALDLTPRTLNALSAAGIRTVGGIARKSEEDLLEVEGIGDKGITEIKKALKKHGLELKA
jgi:DNA-directed RNA polymerase subunit alpha